MTLMPFTFVDHTKEFLQYCWLWFDIYNSAHSVP